MGYVSITIRRDGMKQADYQVAYSNGMNILSALKKIYEELDRTVAYPMCLCRMGRCGACAVRVNGTPVLGCAFRLEEGGSYELEAISDKNVIRDLVSG